MYSAAEGIRMAFRFSSGKVENTFAASASVKVPKIKHSVISMAIWDATPVPLHVIGLECCIVAPFFFFCQDMYQFLMTERRMDKPFIVCTSLSPRTVIPFSNCTLLSLGNVVSTLMVVEVDDTKDLQSFLCELVSVFIIVHLTFMVYYINLLCLS